MDAVCSARSLENESESEDGLDKENDVCLARRLESENENKSGNENESESEQGQDKEWTMYAWREAPQH